MPAIGVQDADDLCRHSSERRASGTIHSGGGASGFGGGIWVLSGLNSSRTSLTTVSASSLSCSSIASAGDSDLWFGSFIGSEIPDDLNRHTGASDNCGATSGSQSSNHRRRVSGIGSDGTQPGGAGAATSTSASSTQQPAKSCASSRSTPATTTAPQCNDYRLTPW